MIYKNKVALTIYTLADAAVIQLLLRNVMFDFLIDLLSEEAQKYKENPKAYEIETKQYYANNKNISHPSDRVNYYLGYAVKTITQNSSLSPQNKLFIRGGDAMNANYIWTAFMIVGSVFPTKFDHKSLGNMVVGFKPDAQMGYMWGFSAQSLHETQFKQHASMEAVKRFLMPFGTGTDTRLAELSNQSKVKTKPILDSLENHPITQETLPLQSLSSTQKNYPSSQSQVFEEQKYDDLPRAQTHRREDETKVNTPQSKVRHDLLTKNAEIRNAEQDAKLKKETLEKEKTASIKLQQLCGKTEAVVTISSVQYYLRAGANIDYQANQDNTALMNAIDAQNDRVAEFLLKRGANPLLANKFGDTAATLISGTSPVLELLNLKIKEKQQQNDSPRVKLSKLLQQEVITMDCQVRNIKQLLNKGADINYQDESGFTALMLAVDRQNDRVAEYLLNQGADPRLPNKDHEIASELVSRNSPLYEILKGYEFLYATVSGDLPQLEILQRAGVDINFQGLGGYTPLLIAVEQAHAQLVEYLLLQGARTDLTRKDGLGVFDIVNDETIFSLLQVADGSENLEESLPDNVEETSISKHGLFSISSNKYIL